MKPGAPTTPLVDREVRKAEVSQRLAAALLRHNSVKTVVAAMMGLRRQRLDEFADPSSDRCLTVADLRALPPAVRLDLLRWMADEVGCFVADLPAADVDPADDLALVAHVQKETSEAVSAHLNGVASGHIDRRAAAEIEREVNEAIGALLTVRALMARIRERGAHEVRRPDLRAVPSEDAAE